MHFASCEVPPEAFAAYLVLQRYIKSHCLILMSLVSEESKK